MNWFWNIYDTYLLLNKTEYTRLKVRFFGCTTSDESWVSDMYGWPDLVKNFLKHDYLLLNLGVDPLNKPILPKDTFYQFWMKLA